MSDEWQALNAESSTLWLQGKYEQAAVVAKKQVEIAERDRGPKHPDVATSLDRLAGIYEAQRRHEAAEPLYRRSLAIRIKAFGPNHLTVASSLNQLAHLHEAQGQYAAAEPWVKRLLAIREKALGPENRSVADSLEHLAELYETQGRYAAMGPLYKRLLAIEEKTFGPDHSIVATSLNRLAGLHETQGQYAAAEPLYRRALAIREKALGLDHPGVAASLIDLAMLYDSQGQRALAEPLEKRSLVIWDQGQHGGKTGRAILEWWFMTPCPTPLNQALKRLEPLGIKWSKWDSDYKPDSISASITETVTAGIFEIGARGFRVKLFVTPDHDADLVAKVVEAKKKLLREVLPLLGARGIKEADPEDGPPTQQEPSLRAKALASRMAQSMENAWWKGQTALVGETDEPLAVVGPRSSVTAEELTRLGERLKNWQQANSFARHIWGLDDLLEGRGPRTPPVYLMVPYPSDRIGECYEPVALVFVAEATDHKTAAESLAHAVGDLRGRLAWFTHPAEYSYLRR